MVKKRAKAATPATRKSDVSGLPDASGPCANCGKAVPAPKKLCQPCVSRLQAIHAADAPEMDRGLSTLLRTGTGRERTRILQNWAQTWHRKNCALAKQLKTLQMSSKVMRRQLDHKEKEIAALKAQQAPAEKVKLGHLHCKKAGGFKNKTIKKRQIKTIRKVSIRPPG